MSLFDFCGKERELGGVRSLSRAGIEAFVGLMVMVDVRMIEAQ